MFITLDWTAPWLGHRHCPVGSSQGLLPAAGNKPPELECLFLLSFFFFALALAWLAYEAWLQALLWSHGFRTTTTTIYIARRRQFAAATGARGEVGLYPDRTTTTTRPHHISLHLDEPRRGEANIVCARFECGQVLQTARSLQYSADSPPGGEANTVCALFWVRTGSANGGEACEGTH